MNGTLLFLLTISVILNYFLFGGYISLLKQKNEMDEWIKELEKIYGSIDKLAEKRRKHLLKKGTK